MPGMLVNGKNPYSSVVKCPFDCCRKYAPTKKYLERREIKRREKQAIKKELREYY